MKRLFPYLPLFVLIFGVIIVQIGSLGVSGMMSSTLMESVNLSEPLCARPENFTQEDENAWCKQGIGENIENNKELWNWSCVLGKESRKCTFTETKNYPTRGGVYFSSK